MVRNQKISLAICIPVWNRGDLFLLSFNSLIKQLDGISASIFIYDNGSDQATKKIIQDIQHDDYLIFKTFLPANMGIPYVVNLFAGALRENCQFAGYVSPDYVLLMDSDAFFKKPIRDLLNLFSVYFDLGLLSGHDSLEHISTWETTIEINNEKVTLKRKEIERMLSMFIRKEELLACYPFPDYRDRDIDWEIAQWNQNSMKRRNRTIYVACGYVLHLGLEKSTWQGNSALFHHSKEEIEEVRAILGKI